MLIIWSYGPAFFLFFFFSVLARHEISFQFFGPCGISLLQWCIVKYSTGVTLFKGVQSHLYKLILSA